MTIVRIGLVAGLTALAISVAAVPASARADVPYCGPSLPSENDFDLNGDGYDDAAVGDPYATVDGQPEAGAVTILFGNASGIGSGERRVITWDSLGGSVKAGDHFGADVTLRRADTGESCADLLIGAPGWDIDGRTDSGGALLLSYFSPEIGQPLQQSTDLIDETTANGTVEAGDRFGSSVEIHPTPEDERRRYVIGIPGEDVGGAVDAGAVAVLDDLDGFLVYQGKLLPGGQVRVPGTPQAGDRFGASVAIGPLDLGAGPGFGLVVGAPGDVVGGRDSAGSVTALSQGDDWFDRAALITQATTGVPGSAEAGDQFGYSVAATRQPGQSTRVAVGAPAEDDGTIRDTGSVTVFVNRSGRLASTAAFSQNTAGFPGANESGDRFGHAVAFGDNSTTLWVGTPLEDLGTATDAGWVQPVRVSGTGSVTPLPAIAENTAGGTVATGNRFGNILGALDGLAEQIMTASSIYAGTGAVWVRSDGGTFRRWAPSAGAQMFGWSVTN